MTCFKHIGLFVFQISLSISSNKQTAFRVSVMRYYVPHVGVGVERLFGSELRLPCQPCGFSFSASRAALNPLMPWV